MSYKYDIKKKWNTWGGGGGGARSCSQALNSAIFFYLC